MILMARLMFLRSCGDNEKHELEVATKSFDAWLSSFSNMPIWQDLDDNAVQDEGEMSIPNRHFEDSRYF
jgi:hypothetical protein